MYDADVGHADARGFRGVAGAQMYGHTLVSSGVQRGYDEATGLALSLH
jgi:hypothetical protein